VLSASVEAERWFIQEHDHFLITMFKLTERGKEGEEPLKSRRTLPEVIGIAVTPIVNPNIEVASNDRGSFRSVSYHLIEIQVHTQLSILFPVLKDLSS